jgi:hypothetical protein
MSMAVGTGPANNGDATDGRTSMIRTLKAALGIGLLVTLAISAMNVMSASALSSGHFISASSDTKLDVKAPTGSHLMVFHAQGFPVECHNQIYTASSIGLTAQEIKVTPALSACTTADLTKATIPHWNGCQLVFTSRTPPGHGTVHFMCPMGVPATLTQEDCTETLDPQTLEGGATYDAIAIEGKSAITVNLTTTNFKTTRHGLCQFFGTNGAGYWTGSLTIQGTDAASGAPVGISHT